MADAGVDQASFKAIFQDAAPPTAQPPVYQAFNSTAPSTAQTPDEQNVIDYTRQHYANGTYMRNPDGSITSFKGMVVGGEDGEPARIIPSYWDGKVVDRHTAFQNAMAYERATGKRWPAYKTTDEALQAEQRIHQTMDADMRFAPQDAQPMADPGLAFKSIFTR